MFEIGGFITFGPHCRGESLKIASLPVFNGEPCVIFELDRDPLPTDIYSRKYLEHFIGADHFCYEPPTEVRR